MLMESLEFSRVNILLLDSIQIKPLSEVKIHGWQLREMLEVVGVVIKVGKAIQCDTVGVGLPDL